MKLLILALFFSCSLFAQRVSQLKPLGIGDKVPDLSFNNLINTSAGSVKLSNYRGKLVILDFWATWCTACLKSFPKLDNISRTRKDVAILLVNTSNTGDSPEKIKAFYNRRSALGSPLSLVTVYHDSILKQYFPHKLIPHTVWLDQNRKVIAITSSEEVTTQNIDAMMKGTRPTMTLKKDVLDYKESSALLENGNGAGLETLLFRSILTKTITGMPTGSRRYADSVIRKTGYFNYDIVSLYQAATKFPLNRIVFDSGSLTTDRYCYELTVPAQTFPALEMNTMLKDLDNYLSMNGRIEKRVMDALVIWINDSMPPPIPGGPGIKIRNKPVTSLVSMLNTFLSVPVVLDERSYKGKISLQLSGDLTDFSQFEKELARNHIEFKRAKTLLDVLVIEKQR